MNAQDLGQEMTTQLSLDDCESFLRAQFKKDTTCTTYPAYKKLRPQIYRSSIVNALFSSSPMANALRAANANQFDALINAHKFEEIPDLNPADEFGVGDLSNLERLLLRAYDSGKSMNILNPAEVCNARIIATFIAQSAARGERVLHISGNKKTTKYITNQLKVNNLESLLLDLGSGDNPKSSSDKIVHNIESPALKIDDYDDKVVEKLTKTREKISEFHNWLLDMKAPFSVSISNLIDIIMDTSDLPEFETRFSRDTCVKTLGKTQALVGEIADLVSHDRKYNDIVFGDAKSDGRFDYRELAIHSLDEIPNTISRLERLMDVSLPALKIYADEICKATGLEKPQTISQWNELANLLHNVRHTLDIFSEDVFERDLDEYIAAFEQKERSSKSQKLLNFFDRTRLIKEANEMVRPGLHVENMSDALKHAQEEKASWLHLMHEQDNRPEVLRGRNLVILPNQVGKALSVSKSLNIDLDSVNELFAKSEEISNLSELKIDHLENVISTLLLKKDALQHAFERTHIVDGLNALGVGELAREIEQLNLDCSQIPRAIDKVLALSIFDCIISSEDNSEHGDQSNFLQDKLIELQKMYRKFARLDKEQINNLLAPVKYFAGQKQMVAHTNLKKLANQKNQVAIRNFVHDYYVAISADKKMLGDVIEISPTFDTLILEHLSLDDLPYLLPALAISKRVVLFADSNVQEASFYNVLERIAPTFKMDSLVEIYNYKVHKLAVLNGCPEIAKFEFPPTPCPSKNQIKSAENAVEVVCKLIEDAIENKTIGYAINVVGLEKDLSRTKRELLKTVRADSKVAAHFARFEKKLHGIVNFLDVEKDPFTQSNTCIFLIRDEWKKLSDRQMIATLLSVNSNLVICAQENIRDSDLSQLIDELLINDNSKPIIQHAQNSPEYDSMKYFATMLKQKGYLVYIRPLLNGEPSLLSLVVATSDESKWCAVLVDSDQFTTSKSLRFAFRQRVTQLKRAGWIVCQVAKLMLLENPNLAVATITDALSTQDVTQLQQAKKTSQVSDDARGREMLDNVPPHHV